MTDEKAVAKKQTTSPLESAQKVYNLLSEVPGSLAFLGGRFYRYNHDMKLWHNATRTVCTSCASAAGGRQVPQVIDMVKERCRAPEADEGFSPFFRWDSWGDGWNQAGWEAYEVGQDEIVFVDGILNVRTGVFKDMNQPIFGPVITIPYRSLPNIRSGQPWPDKFKTLVDTIEKALPDSHGFFKQVFSFVIRPHIHFRHGLYLIGAAGSRKSTVATALLNAPCGGAGVSQVSEKRLGNANDRFASSGLINKIANLSDDMSGGPSFIDFFKSYTGSSTFGAEHKFEQGKRYYATAKLVSCCNSLPPIFDATDAIASRLIVFEFQKVHDGDAEPEVVSLSEHLSVNYWQDVRGHIVAWLIEGLKEVLEAGTLRKPESMVVGIKEHMEELDPTRRWLNENVIVDQPESFVPTAALLGGLATIGATIGPRALAEMLRRKGATPWREGTEQARGWRGISLKTDR